MLLNNLFESRYGAAAGVETIRQLVHAVKNSQDIDLKVGPEMFPVNYGDARYLLQYWKANREGGDATAEYFGDANWIEAKLAKRDYTMSPDRLKDIDQERMKSKEYDRMVGIEEDIPADYKGWKYDVEYIEDEDTRKKLHSATKDGKQVSIDWTPYATMSDEQFKTWIDLGMPDRETVSSIGPLTAQDLEQLMKTKLGTRARLAQEGKPTDIELDVLKYTDEQVAKAITIARGSDGDMTGATDRIEAIADGLSNHSDVAKVLKIANEAKDDDITKKLDPKTKVALKKAQMKSAGLTKGDPIASLAYGLEKDVNRLDKENDQEQADIASQELVDKYHSQELEQLKKSLTNILKK